MAPGQKFGPQNPGQPWTDKPYNNLAVPKNKPEYAKKDSGHLRFPLEQVHAALKRPRLGNCGPRHVVGPHCRLGHGFLHPPCPCFSPRPTFQLGFFWGHIIWCCLVTAMVGAQLGARDGGACWSRGLLP